MAPRIDSAFDRFDSKLEDLTKRKVQKKVEDTRAGEPHRIKLPKGVIPYHETLSPYQKLARKIMLPVVERRYKSAENPKLEIDLMKSHMKFRVEDYVAFVWFTAIVGAIVAAVVGVLITVVFAIIKAQLILYLAVGGLAVIPVVIYFILMALPGMSASSRAKNIDKRMAYAMSFISAMASADVNVSVIFKELSRQKIYGEIQKEAQWITRDAELLGTDILTCIKEAANRTPSTKFQEFLQGVVTTTSSGGQLKPYFLMKAEQYSKQNRMDQKKTLEVLGLLAESFVVVVVAMPLFLVVMMSLMSMVGNNASSVDFLYLIVFMMVPMSQVGFIIVIQSMSEEV